MYNFLASAVGAYLAGYEQVSIYFLRDIVSGKKKCKYRTFFTNLSIVIKSNEMKHIFIPYYEGLSVECLLEECFLYPEVKKYLPDGPDIARITRQWLANVAYSVIGEPFAVWVKAKVDERNIKVSANNNLTLDLDPEIAAAFKASTQVSSKYLPHCIIDGCFVRHVTNIPLLIVIAQKGSSANLLKLGTKRRKTKHQILAEREEAELKA